jgi:hypothetical protein
MQKQNRHTIRRPAFLDMQDVPVANGHLPDAAGPAIGKQMIG